MTENPTKNTTLADESLFDEQITTDFIKLDLNSVNIPKLYKKLKCPRCRDFICDVLTLDIDLSNVNQTTFTSLLGISDRKTAKAHLGHLQVANIVDIKQNSEGHKIVKFEKAKKQLITKLPADELIYEWYEIVSPFYPNIAEHLELDNNYNIALHYPSYVKYELNGCSTWNQIAEDNPAMLFTETYLERIRKLSGLEDNKPKEPMIEMQDGSFISLKEAEERLKAMPNNNWKKVYTDNGDLHPISLIASGYKFSLEGETYGE